MGKKIEWTDAARADVRRIDRETAMRILEGLARFLLTEEGDIKLLKDSDPKEYRLRVGDYRIRFMISGIPFRSCPSGIAAKRTADTPPPWRTRGSRPDRGRGLSLLRCGSLIRPRPICRLLASRTPPRATPRG